MRIIKVNEEYQQGYEYPLSKPEGRDFDDAFKPELTPAEMLGMGIFGGNYFTSPPKEFPKDWFTKVVFSKTGHSDPKLNFFQVNASQPLIVWERKGWIHPEDPKGWFLWYCRYFMGRRVPEEDERQITRWRNMRRHVSQLQNSCQAGDWSCRPKQRQALLHWAYDSRRL